MRHICLLTVQIPTDLVNMKISDSSYILCYMFYLIFESPNSVHMLYNLKHINYQYSHFFKFSLFYLFCLVNVIALIIRFYIFINISHLFTADDVWGAIQIILSLSTYLRYTFIIIFHI